MARRRAPGDPMPEPVVKDMVKAWYDARGAWSFAPVSNGMGKHGIHDRVGCVPITITPDMVGKRIGAFVSVEAKSTGRRGEKNRGMSKNQYENMVEILVAGGASTVCDGEEDLKNLTRLWPWLT